LRRVAGYTRKGQIRNTKIKEELNIFNLNTKIIKSRSQWKCNSQQKKMDSEENFNIESKSELKHNDGLNDDDVMMKMMKMVMMMMMMMMPMTTNIRIVSHTKSCEVRLPTYTSIIFRTGAEISTAILAA
jgi:hypothetical protein